MVFHYFLHLDFFLKCLLSVLVGGVVGLEREYRRKPAGVKTHALIALGSAILCYMSSHFSGTSDPSRIAAQIVSGIGFIGAGTILHSRRAIYGLTTAATLWTVASLGMLIGAGMIVPAVTATIIVITFLFVTKAFTKEEGKRRHYSLTIEIKKLKSLEKIEELVESFELHVDHKALTRNRKVIFELAYSANPLTQHLFLRRLLTMTGLGEISAV